MMFGLSKLESILIGTLVCLVAFGLWSWHEQRVGSAKLIAADQKALVAAQIKVAAENAQLQTEANQAHQEAQNAQAQLDSYVAAHPVGVVRVCHVAPSSGNGVPQAAGTAAGTEGAGTQPGPVSAVSAGSAGPDISGGLAILVQAAARLAVLDAERQQVAGLQP